MSDDRYILVVADNSEEMNTALEYACARSKKTGRKIIIATFIEPLDCLLYTSPSPRDLSTSRMPSSA